MGIHYSHHGGHHYVAVVHCPGICGDRLVHLSQDGQDSWVIRDYIAGQQLRRSPSPSSLSTYTLAQIEAEVAWSEPAEYMSVECFEDWKQNLRAQTRQVLGDIDTSPPNPAFGRWHTLRGPRTRPRRSRPVTG